MITEKFKRLLVILITICISLSFTGCPWDPKPKVLNIPFHEQEKDNYCGIACIQMWHHYMFPGPDCFATQKMIASELGVGDRLVPPQKLFEGVQIFCGIFPHLEERFRWESGAKGDLIGSSVTGIIEDEPSILPCEHEHAVLAIGYLYHYKDIIDEYGYIVDTIPIADFIYFHDPRGLVKERNSVAQLLNWFEPQQGYDYWIILARQYYAPVGVQGHDDFVRAGGTYRGGPISYNPKDL